ncbi:uncharacterized protein G2W53_035083 [Senna tora]|uniref:Uncharacterized protein n=1 Tax=Senna tora TaxID=362788 RepID=A0A834W3T0_9FABA|nr:uncharacterized protein G2W53_035083 [Senna tora]
MYLYKRVFVNLPKCTPPVEREETTFFTERKKTNPRVPLRHISTAPIVEVEINEESSSSDNYDSAEDEVYKPGPKLFEVQEEDIPKHAKKKKGKAKARDKGQNVVHEEEEDEGDVQYHDLHDSDSDPEDGFAEELL